MIHSVFDLVGVPVLVAIFLILFLLETIFQLRKRVEHRWVRIFINSIVSLPAFSLLRFLLLPAMVLIAFKNLELHFGLNYWLRLPAWIACVIGFLLLDYGNYIWHLLNHKYEFLWRFHMVHHTDHDLDITTAFRFHFGEMVGSVFFRGAIVLLTGVSPMLVLVYEIVFEACTQFHHSNWKIPISAERILNKLIVTPRMHGIHHSVIKAETDSNYAVIFSFWDRLHHTIRLNIGQAKIKTGVPAYDDAGELTIGFLLKLPFTKLRPWKKDFLKRAGDGNDKSGMAE